MQPKNQFKFTDLVRRIARQIVRQLQEEQRAESDSSAASGHDTAAKSKPKTRHIG